MFSICIVFGSSQQYIWQVPSVGLTTLIIWTCLREMDQKPLLSSFPFLWEQNLDLKPLWMKNLCRSCLLPTLITLSHPSFWSLTMLQPHWPPSIPPSRAKESLSLLCLQDTFLSPHLTGLTMVSSISQFQPQPSPHYSTSRNTLDCTTEVFVHLQSLSLSSLFFNNSHHG